MDRSASRGPNVKWMTRSEGSSVLMVYIPRLQYLFKSGMFPRFHQVGKTGLRGRYLMVRSANSQPFSVFNAVLEAGFKVPNLCMLGSCLSFQLT